MTHAKGGVPHEDAHAPDLSTNGAPGRTRRPAHRRGSERQLAVAEDPWGPGEPRAPRDPLAFRVYAFAAVATVGALAVAGGVDDTTRRVALGTVAVWWFLCGAANVLAVPAERNVYLSMSSPVNVAIAWLFSPAIAAVVVATGSLSEWELRRQTTVVHSLFNRAQLGLSAAAASATMAVPAGGVSSPARAIAGVVVYQAANWLLVAVAERTSRRTPVLVLVRRLLPAGPVAAAVYLTLGLMGIALALTYQRVGAWAVLLLMLPILGARQAVKASQDVERAEREQRVLADRVIDERERERVRVASDIHDVVLQDLAALQLQADNIVSALRADLPTQAVGLAEHTRTMAARTIADLRSSVASLRRVTLDVSGLAATLERYARSFHAQTGIEVGVDADEVASTEVTTAQALLLYETCQEALTNVAAHADASHVAVTLRRRGATWELRIRDDGRGLASEGARSEGGAGLSLVREKVALAGGGVWVDAPRGGGLELIVRVPGSRTSRAT